MCYWRDLDPAEASTYPPLETPVILHLVEKSTERVAIEIVVFKKDLFFQNRIWINRKNSFSDPSRMAAHYTIQWRLMTECE